MSELQQFCMSCGGAISFDISQAGTSIFCLHCGQKVQLKSDSATPPEPSQSPPPPAINDTPEEIFLFIDNQQHGPYSEANLYEDLKAGHITPETLVWWEGKQGWEPLSQQTELNLGLTSSLRESGLAPTAVAPEEYDSFHARGCRPMAMESPGDGRVDGVAGNTDEQDDEENSKKGLIEKLAWGIATLHLLIPIIFCFLSFGKGDYTKKTNQYWRNSWNCLFWSCQVVDRDFEGTSVFSKKYAPAIKCKFLGITYMYMRYESKFIEKSHFGNQTSVSYVKADESEGHPMDYYSFMEKYGYLAILFSVTALLLENIVLPFALTAIRKE